MSDIDKVLLALAGILVGTFLGVLIGNIWPFSKNRDNPHDKLT